MKRGPQTQASLTVVSHAITSQELVVTNTWRALTGPPSGIGSYVHGPSVSPWRTCAGTADGDTLIVWPL